MRFTAGDLFSMMMAAHAGPDVIYGFKSVVALIRFHDATGPPQEPSCYRGASAIRRLSSYARHAAEPPHATEAAAHSLEPRITMAFAQCFSDFR